MAALFGNVECGAQFIDQGAWSELLHYVAPTFTDWRDVSTCGLVRWLSRMAAA
jgi:hypothetical protein